MRGHFDLSNALPKWCLQRSIRRDAQNAQCALGCSNMRLRALTLSLLSAIVLLYGKTRAHMNFFITEKEVWKLLGKWF